jgi:D-alanyl-D-alanine carboxypeptidase/D-alanyl-D-alanine-endopeptidase (penicillin-binding protein 4)
MRTRPTLALLMSDVRRDSLGLTCAVLALSLATPALHAASSSTHIAPGTATDLPPALIAPLRASGVPASAVSLLVLPVEGGPARLAHEARVVRQVASVMKLFTTGVALQSLGPAYTWHTDAALGGPLRPDGTLDGPLYLRGSGDPSLVMEKVQLMLSHWRAAGLARIKGDLLLDRRAFDLPPHDPAAFDGKQLKPYNAGPDALLLNLQAISLRLTPDAARPGKVLTSMEPELDGVQLEVQIKPQVIGSCGDWREAMSLRMLPRAEAGSTTASTEVGAGPAHGAQEPASAALASAHATAPARRPWTIQLSGPYPLSCGEREWPVLWQGDGPGDHAERLLARSWAQVGGQLSGHIKQGNWPDQAVVWQSWTSPPLGVVVRDINKFSNNVMARQLFLTLAPGPGPATLDKARQAVTQQVIAATPDAAGVSTSTFSGALAGTSPCAEGALVLDNGSGLSRNERSSAACLGRWVQAMWASPVMPEWLASLPVTGTDGTAKRLSSVVGKAHMKTGSLEGVAAMAGVVEGDSGRRYAVVGIVNHTQADAARPLLEALIAWAAHDRPAGN